MADPKPLGELTPLFVTRFWTHVEQTEECWNWTGHIDAEGYGRVKLGTRVVGAHRVAVTVARGEIPSGLVIDHLCRNRRCVRPSHLEAVTNVENIKRGFPGRKPEPNTRTECLKGHDMTGENLMPQRGGKYFICRTCNREYMRLYMRAYKAKGKNAA